MGFRSYLLRRLVYAVIVLFVILTFNFVLFRVMPGDPEKMIIDPNFTQEAKAELRRQYGLDDPPLTQYKNYMSALLRFDMGLSFNTRRPVWSELKERLPNTITLFLVTFISTAAVGISIGVYSAANRGRFTEKFVVGAGLFAHAVPGFFVQLLLLLAFGYYWPILPIHGTMSAPPPDGAFAQFLDRVWHIILPAGSNLIMGFGSWALYTRNTMLEALGQDYIVTARAKGLPKRDILYHHALRSVLPPIVTLIFMSLPGAVSGAVITESIFSWHGVGRYLLDATLQLDYPAAQGAFYLIALAVIISNLLADIAYGLVDPRIRVGAGGTQVRQDAKAAQRADVAKAAAAAVPRPLTFWEQYRRKPQGMVGLAIVLAYVLVAVFAPFLAPYDPMNDLYLADMLAAPAWLAKLSAKYRDCPPTIRIRLGLDDWTQEDLGEAVVSSFEHEEGPGIQFDLPPTEAEAAEEEELFSPFIRKIEWNPWGTEDSGEDDDITSDEAEQAESSRNGVVLSYSTSYRYRTPNTFSAKFEYEVDAPESAETFIMLELVTPDGEVRDLWDTTVTGSVDYANAIVDARDLDLKLRLGLSFFDEPSQVLFGEKGDYTIRLNVSAVSPDGPVKVKTGPLAFEVLGMVHGVLGVDHMGSDLWSQLIYGTRIALAIGLSTAFIAVAIGTTVGIVAGYVGGAVDEFLMRVVDVLLAIPSLPILIILGALFGKSVANIVILLALLSWMGIARLVRSQTLSLKERTFVEAARASGASSQYVMLHHILPNVMPLIFANLVLRIPGAILTEASLSFLGLGDPRVATWGRILQNARQFGAFTIMAWWWLIPPGLALTFMSLAFVFIGNSVNEILNPRYRERS